MDKAVDYFTKLVQIDSPSGEEIAVSEFLKTWLVKMGYEFRSDKLGSILAEPKNITPQILICAHMDTVEPGRGIKPKIENGIIKSDGTTILGGDNKAALSAILTAIENYVESQHQLPAVELLFTVREETGGGAEFFPFSWIKAKKGILFDYSRPFGRIIISSPFIYNFKVKFIGHASHSSRPEEGNNSLLPATRFISKVPIGKFDNGQTTINIGLVSCGTGINVIPAQTFVQGEVRSTNKELFDKYLSDIKQSAESIAAENSLKVEYSQDGFCPGYQYSPQDAFIQEISQIYTSLGYQPHYDHSTGISDANPLVGAGIQMVNLSDSVEHAHSVDEKISVENLTTLSKIVGHMITELT